MQLDDSDGALDCWAGFYALTGELVGGAGDLSVCSCLATVVADLYARGLATLVRDYFLHNLEVRNSRLSFPLTPTTSISL
jgi:anaphase-promoting complex subunit 2